MRVIAVLLSGFLGAAFAADGSSRLEQVRAVYVLPKVNGLDQFLANRITNAGVFEVVTDAKKADAILTDRLGAALERRLGELYPEPEPPKPAPAKEEKKEKDEDASRAPAVVAAENPGLANSSFLRGKGNIFLVDPHTRAVVWSVYHRPAGAAPENLDRTAGRIVDQLKHDREKTAKKK